MAVRVSGAAFSSLFKTRAALQFENVALRHQIGVLQRGTKRPKLTVADRLFWVALSRMWGGWRSALAIVKPETVIAWHRKGFQLFWTGKVRRGKPGRPAVPAEVRDLIRTMSRDNPLWGAPHKRLLKDLPQSFTGRLSQLFRDFVPVPKRGRQAGARQNSPAEFAEHILCLAPSTAPTIANRTPRGKMSLRRPGVVQPGG